MKHAVRKRAVRTAIGLWLLGAAVGCFRQTMDDRTVCDEYRDLRCLTSTECAMDHQRGCRVCRCSDTGIGGVAPDRPRSGPR